MSFLLPILSAAWKPLALILIVAIVWIGVRHGVNHVKALEAQVAEQQTKLTEAADTIAKQNAAVEMLRAEGQRQQETIEGLAKEAQVQAGKVVTQWKTKYVQTPIPAECPAAVSAGAVNAASIARLFMGKP